MNKNLKVKSGFDWCQNCKEEFVKLNYMNFEYLCDKCRKIEEEKEEKRILKRRKENEEKRNRIIKSLKGKIIDNVKVKLEDDWYEEEKVISYIEFKFNDKTKIKIDTRIQGWYDDALTFINIEEE